MEQCDQTPDSWREKIIRWRRLLAKTLDALAEKREPAMATARPPMGPRTAS